MNRCQFAVLLLLLARPLVMDVGAEEPVRPNILYFYVDDMGWGSIGPNGQAERESKGRPYVRTPHLNQLARQGVNFTRGYGCHVCSPARSSQQTGFHQGHTFADRNDPNNAKKAMRADDILIGDALSAAGYATGYWGKWGYGGSKDHDHPVIENVQTLPTSHGYQHVLAELHHVRAHTFFQPTLWSAPAVPKALGGLELIPNSMSRYQNQSAYPAAPALQDHPEYPQPAYCDDAYAFAALEFVRGQALTYHRTGQPFFGLLAVQIPHAPFDEITKLPNWDSAYADDPHFASLADQSQQWAAMVTRIDQHFGNILTALEDPNNDGDTSDSIADNTLVIFQSDNGGPGGKCNIELDANGGLRGTKGKIQEGGIRVPLIMRWPSKITSQSSVKRGSNTDIVVDVTDLLPTFCDLAGAPVPLGIDGVSIAPMLTGTGHQRTREFIIHEASNGQLIIRGNQKLVQSRKSPPELYDLATDPAETNDLAANQPELVKELQDLLRGERVDEPRGFANTYHHWTGPNQGNLSESNHWSEYIYANAGITYMTDDGAPQLSWVARIENNSAEPRSAVADADLEFLALQIGGGNTPTAVQSLTLGRHHLNCRNELRIGRLGKLELEQGTVSSLRWIDVQSGGSLAGHGVLSADVYNAGLISTKPDKRLKINGDYIETVDAQMSLSPATADSATVLIKGTARLAGTLNLQVNGELAPVPGQAYPVLTAQKIEGRFQTDDGKAIDGSKRRYRIDYSESAVSVIFED